MTAVVLLLLLTEVVCRTIETRISADIRYLRSLPEISQRLSTVEHGTLRVLVIGNSLAREGIDLDDFQKQLGERLGQSVHVEGFYPDGSNIVEWSWGFRRYFGDANHSPDLVVVVTGRTHLVDTTGKFERLGAFHVSNSDLAEALQTITFETWPRLLLARISTAFSSRDRLRPLIGYNFLPGYAAAMENLTLSRRIDSEGDDPSESEGTDVNVSALKRLMDACQETGSQIIIATIPMVMPFQLPNAVAECIASSEAEFVDLSSLDGLRESDFPDGYHLGLSGRRTFTARVVDAVFSIYGVKATVYGEY